MTNHLLLDNITHKDLRIITRRSAAYGDGVASAGVFPAEFRQLQVEYPIVFRKLASSGQFEPVVMFGFEKGENLFLQGDHWAASYVPLSIERQPFMIGFKGGDGAREEMVIHIDMDSPRISQSDGERVFLDYGGVSPYLEHIRSALLAIHEGHEANRRFSAMLAEFDLLEPFLLDVELKNGAKHKLTGFYTINEESLARLNGEALEKLHAAGCLEPLYMAMASLANFKKLIDRKNASL